MKAEKPRGGGSTEGAPDDGAKAEIMPERGAGGRAGRAATTNHNTKNHRHHAPAAASASGAMVVRSNYDPDHRVVAVTGAAAFLGTALIRKLEEDRRYTKVLAIDIRRPDIPATKTRFHKVDLTLPNADAEVAQVLKREGVDTMVHLAFLTKPTHNTAWAHELEAIGSLHVLNASAACKVHKVVQWSLTALYGPNPTNPNYLRENRRVAGVEGSRFFADKVEAERLARRYRTENPSAVVTILRTAAILGRRANNYVSQYFSLPIVPVLLGYDPLIQLLHEEDAVAALKLVVDGDFNGEYNIAGDGVLPLSTALAMSGKLTVALPHLVAYPLAKVLWMAQVLDFAPRFLDFLRYLCVAETDKARQEIGFTPAYDIRAILTDFAGASNPAPASPSSAREGAVNAL